MQIEHVLHWIDLSEKTREARATEQTLARQKQDYQQSVEPLRTKLSDAETQLVTAQQQLALHEERVAAASQTVIAIEAEITKLEATKKSLESSVALVTDTQVIQQATSEIDNSIANRVSKLGTAQSNVSGLAQDRAMIQSNMASLAAIRDVASSEWATAQAEIARLDTEIAKSQLASQSLVENCTEARSIVIADRQLQSAMASDRPLSPEQLGWSILRSTGVLQSYVLNENAELDKQSALAADATDEQRAGRRLQATRGAMDKLRGNVDVFSNLYSSGVGQTSDEFFASPDQALYVANGGSVYAWAGPNGSNVTSQLLAETDIQAAVKKLYWSLLSRSPTPEELGFVTEQLTNAGEQRPAIVQELVWSILASAEYRLYP
jgi:flagellar biosynthesis chaperone FliJ